MMSQWPKSWSQAMAILRMCYIMIQLNTGQVFTGKMGKKNINTQKIWILLVQMGKDVEIAGIAVIFLIII